MGPTCSILLDKRIDLTISVAVDNFLRSIITHELNTPKVSRDFQVDSTEFQGITKERSTCEFHLSFDNKLELVDEELIVELELAINFKVQSQIIIAAGCNQQGDHNVLAELIYEITKITGGLIDYGQDILKHNVGPQKDLKGFIYGIEYNHGMAINHIVDLQYFGEWLTNNKNNLRMAK